MMKTKRKEKLLKFLNKILNKIEDVEYELIDLEDDDINFWVTINSIKDDESNNMQFALYYSDNNTLTLFCPKVYKIRDNDSTMFLLNALNIVNTRIAVGKIYLNKNSNTVISYINRILFNDITKELTSDLLNSYIESFILCSLEFYNEMKGYLNE